MIGIYKITCLKNNKVYVGQSVNLKNRIRNHKNKLRRNSHEVVYMQNSWNKYGEDKFKFDIIEECEELKLSEREVYWINFYNSYKDGFNRTIGGEGVKRNLIICLNTKKVYSSMIEVEQLFNIANSNLSKACSGIRRSCGKDNLGRPLIWRYYEEGMRTEYSDEELFQMSKPIIKKTDFDKIICLNTGKVYSSTTEAEKEYNINNICKCLSGEYKTCGIDKKSNDKLIWMRYDLFLNQRKSKEEIIEYIISVDNVKTKVVSIFDNGRVFDSLLECADYYGIKYQNIVSICSNKKQISATDKNHKRQSFMYYNEYILYNKEEIQEHINTIKNKIIKKVICIETNKIYNSLSEASKECNISAGYLSKICKNGKICRGLHFCYLNN